jgi:uncharacterized membrane protein YgcG
VTAAEAVVMVTAVMVVMPAVVARAAPAEVAVMVVVAEVTAAAMPMRVDGAGFACHGLDGGGRERSGLGGTGGGGKNSAGGESGRNEQGTASMHGHSELLGLRTPV